MYSKEKKIRNALYRSITSSYNDERNAGREPDLLVLTPDTFRFLAENAPEVVVDVDHTDVRVFGMRVAVTERVDEFVLVDTSLEGFPKP